MAKKKKRKTGGLAKFQSFIKRKTKAKTAKVRKAEAVLNRAKRELKTAKNKATKQFKRRRK